MPKWIEEKVDKFLEDAEFIYELLESDTHKVQYTLLGKKVIVAIRKKFYEGEGV